LITLIPVSTKSLPRSTDHHLEQKQAVAASPSTALSAGKPGNPPGVLTALFSAMLKP